ncbi:Tolloid-like protein 1 [Labeo rohita]|uniref:Tolloid-like protein 1 n=1 Tax=Labeo rohita TaxID=84645 RepID=A0ABQ8MCC0_LABRO|nr:Tolloid-like protein 1 [Labeo rohita]
MTRIDLPKEEVACVATSEDLWSNFFFWFDKINWKKRPMLSGPDGQLSLDQYRLVSYRIIMEWALRAETLSRGNQKSLPSCMVRYPSESGVYVGFQEAEDAINIL